MASALQSAHAWWKEAVVYQVYPSSFLSTGAGDTPGWGDIRGIASKLDYLKELGIDVVWTSPIFKSPQVDMGYDIADYLDVDSKYGNLADVDALIQGLKQRGMKLMMDLVVNHTSDQHEWFKQSRSSKTNKYRDWYHWQPAKHDKDGNRIPPNNWALILGEANSAWTWDEISQEYYLALFTPEQPDLNWENPDVRKAVHDVMKFWLDRGVCGFRMDVINHISKVPGYPDADIVDPTAQYHSGDKYFANGPRLHEFLQDIRKEVLSKYDTITVGEMPFVDNVNEIIQVVGQEKDELNMIFIFDIVTVDTEPGYPRMTLHDWKPDVLRKIITRWQTVMQERGGWNSLFIENHDNPRSVSRYTDDADNTREFGAKLLALMQTTLSGTLYVYQGEEIGMRNVPASWDPKEYKDVETINYWKKMNQLHPGNDEQLQLARKVITAKARDHARTPVQWTDGPNAGFCDVATEPWMRVNDDYRTINAAAQVAANEPHQLSVWQFWQRALANRKKEKDVFVYGTYELIDAHHESVIAYRRASEEKAFAVALNFSGKADQWQVQGTVKIQEWVAGTYSSESPSLDVKGTITLQPWEGILGLAA